MEVCLRYRKEGKEHQGMLPRSGKVNWVLKDVKWEEWVRISCQIEETA